MQTRHWVWWCLASLPAGIAAAAIPSCRAEEPDGPTATAAAALTIAANRSIGGPPWLHETAVAAGTIPSSGHRRWVVFSNNCRDPLTCNAEIIPAWSYSSDSTGTSWTAKTMATNLDFGNPGSGTAGAFTPNGGWLGDPSLAPVTDPALSNNGSRVLFTSLGFDSAWNINDEGSDVLVALSQDGGGTWGNAHYVNVLGCGNGGGCAGGGTDSTFVVSDPNSPYSTYVAWTAENTGYMNWVQYDAAGVFHNGSTVIKIADTETTGALHPKFTFGKIITCSSAVDEAIFAAWSVGGGSDCAGTPTTEHVTWHWAAFDTITQTWYPPGSSWIMDDDPNWPICIGNPINATVGKRAQNRPFVSAVALNNQVVFVHDQASPVLGTRIVSRGFTLGCQGGTMVPVVGPSYQTPDPCFRPGGCAGADGGGGGNGPDGGSVINDEWGPVASLLITPPSTTTFLVTWYGTRVDVSNNKTSIYGGTTSSLFGNPFASILPISGGTGVPWDHTLADWWDYQAIGTDTVNHQLLAAWGGDARSGASDGVWTALMKP